MTIAILIHALLFLAFWLTNLPFQETSQQLSGQYDRSAGDLFDAGEINQRVQSLVDRIIDSKICR